MLLVRENAELRKSMQNYTLKVAVTPVMLSPQSSYITHPIQQVEKVSLCVRAVDESFHKEIQNNREFEKINKSKPRKAHPQQYLYTYY